MRQYYTLIVWELYDDDTGDWNDVFGSYFKSECEEEKEYSHDHEKRSWVKIIKHDDTAAAMIATRNAMPPPKGQVRE